MDGGVATVPLGQPVILFGGRVPPNGFVVSGATNCFVNDNGPASQGIGFYLVADVVFTVNGSPGAWSGTSISPHGYKPMGPVSIWCNFAARGW
jgi:hypothetical protein